MIKNCKIQQFVDTSTGRLYYCSACKKYLSKEKFCLQSKHTYRDCLSSRCRECSSKNSKKVRQNLVSNQALEYMLRSKLSRAKCRAKQSNLLFTITLNDLYDIWNEQCGKCAISDIPMTYILGNGNIMTNISVDQINPKAGYTKDNVQLVCWAVNRMKGEMDMKELLYFVNAIHSNIME